MAETETMQLPKGSLERAAEDPLQCFAAVKMFFSELFFEQRQDGELANSLGEQVTCYACVTRTPDDSVRGTVLPFRPQQLYVGELSLNCHRPRDVGNGCNDAGP